MRKSLFTVLGTAAALGAALLTTTAASAAPNARAATLPPVPTIVTFTVGTGDLGVTAPPGPISLGTGLPGSLTTITGAVGPVIVTDNRALLAPTWTASAASTDFTGTETGVNIGATIPAGAATYDPGLITAHTGTITATPQTPITLSVAGAPVVLGTAGAGDNSATWNPTETVAVPAQAVGGAYTSTLTESVL